MDPAKETLRRSICLFPIHFNYKIKSLRLCSRADHSVSKQFKLSFRFSDVYMAHHLTNQSLSLIYASER